MDAPQQLEFSKTIFVMEDVDAAGSVVHKRSSDNNNADFRDSLRKDGDAQKGDGSDGDGTKDGTKDGKDGGSTEGAADKKEVNDCSAPTLRRQGSSVVSGAVGATGEADGDAEIKRQKTEKKFDFTAPSLRRQVIKCERLWHDALPHMNAALHSYKNASVCMQSLKPV
jgi:hypothetical protein